MLPGSPTLFATDRRDRVTYTAQGWKVTGPAALADIGPVPEHELGHPLVMDRLARLLAGAVRPELDPGHDGDGH